MRWDRFFEDLEDQLDSEWEAERAALDSEAERLRLSRLTLRERFLSLPAASAPPLSIELADGSTVAGVVSAIGADWAALTPDGGQAGAMVFPLDAVVAIGMPEAELLRSARSEGAAASPRGLRERMTLGFVLRDLARRRVAVTLHLRSGRTIAGTIDRALADHLDLAVHDPALPRRRGEVTGMRLVPLAAIAWMRLDVPAL